MTTVHTSGGIGFVGALTLIFITLKLLDKITWSWWWVLSPIWIGAIIILIVFLIVFMVAYWSTR
jgi:hypothetical protein